VDGAAAALYRQDPRLARDYLTRHTVEAGDRVTARWRDLSKFLLYKFLDGNVKDEHGEVKHPEYPAAWYAAIVAQAGERLRVRKVPAEIEDEKVAKEKVTKTAQSVLALLGARGLAVDEATRAKILATDDAKTLEGWLVRAATAASASEVIE
jgi:hypothetical protein